MKIYPCAHQVKIKKQVGLGDIPLAYLSGNEEGRTVRIELKEDFAKPYSKHAIQPYEPYKENDMYFFDERERPQDARLYLVKENRNYYLKPLEVISESSVHSSEKFSYKVQIKKEDNYRKAVSYDISIAANGEEIMNALSALFCGSKPDAYPSNVIFNGGGQTLKSFINHSADMTDFMFAKKEDYDTEEKIKDALENHMNLWLFDDTFNGSIQSSEEDIYYNLSDPQIFFEICGNASEYGETAPFKYFSTAEEWQLLSKEDGYEYITLFDDMAPVQIIFKDGYGYVVLAHSNMLKNISAYATLILEVMMFIYLHSYYKTDGRTSFVTDEPIDYYLNTNTYFGLCHPRISLTTLLYECGFNQGINYNIDNVIFLVGDGEYQNAVYTGTNRYNELQFRKISEPLKDRAKGNNILAYTKDKTLLVYKKPDTKLYDIESGVEIRILDDLTIAVSPCKSTRYRISTIQEQILNVPIAGKYSIVFDYTKEEFKISKGFDQATQVLIAEMTVEDNVDIVFQDIRTPGGGEQSSIPNYEMIDTGSLLGRPLRYGSLLIIQLPIRYKKMKDVLMSEIQKHMTSGDYPILVFKE